MSSVMISDFIQVYLPKEKNIQNHAKLSRRKKELGEKTGILVGLEVPLVCGGTEAGV